MLHKGDRPDVADTLSHPEWMEGEGFRSGGAVTFMLLMCLGVRCSDFRA